MQENLEFVNTGLFQEETILTVCVDRNTVCNCACFVSFDYGKKISGYYCMLGGTVEGGG